MTRRHSTRGRSFGGLRPVVDFVRRLTAVPEVMAPQIHDRWLARMRAIGFVYGPVNDARRRMHRLLKPYSAFTGREREVETALTRGDLVAIERALSVRVGAPPSGAMGGASTIGSTLLRAACDPAFLRDVAISTHENWRRVKLAARIDLEDPRLDFGFLELREAERRVSLDNAMIDIVAVAGFADGLVASGVGESGPPPP